MLTFFCVWFWCFLGEKLQDVFTQQCRTATKKAGGSVKRQGHNKKRKGKRYGPKVDQGVHFNILSDL